MVYQIPSQYFYRLHHVRPRFKNDVEEVLLYVANAITELDKMPKQAFDSELNNILFKFKNNATSTKKTIDNWRTEISALFAFIQENDNEFFASLTARRLSTNQYLDEFFNYFLYTFQYPAGHVKPHTVIEHIRHGVKFKPCDFILKTLIEGTALLGKPFSITAEELTQCAYYDLRVTAHHTKSPLDVARQIIDNRKNKVEYNHQYPELQKADGSYPSQGDVYRYAGDILDYMVLANLLTDKGTGRWYYLNDDNKQAIDYHLNNPVWFSAYDQYYQQATIPSSEITKLEKYWFDYVNSFDNIEAFAPHLGLNEMLNLSDLIQEYYIQLGGGQKVPTKIIGDYGETLVLAHEHLRTIDDNNNRRHLINKIPTPLGVGYDVQSIEIPSRKRYIEVKTTKSKKALTNNKVRLTPNEWDSAMTLADRYFIYYLVINENSKNIFVIQNPVKQLNEGKLKLDKNWVVEFTEGAGQWEQLLEVQN